MNAGEHTPNQHPVIADRLKTLSTAELVFEILEDARLATTYLSGGDRLIAEQRVENISWVPTDAEQAVYDEHAARVDELLSELSSAIIGLTTDEYLEPEEASLELSRRNRAHDLWLIERDKQDLEAVLAAKAQGTEVMWNTGDIKGQLLTICERQAKVGIATENDYVRETAMAQLASSDSLLGIVLLTNSLNGDEASYEPGLQAIQAALEAKRMGWDIAHRGLKLVPQLIQQSKDPRQQLMLRHLGIDLLLRLREWCKPGMDSYSRYYAEEAAVFAVFLRDFDSDITH